MLSLAASVDSNSGVTGVTSTSGFATLAPVRSWKGRLICSISLAGSSPPKPPYPLFSGTLTSLLTTKTVGLS
eukprot:15716748-Heterocapsa_arctica.AAC.1